MHVVKIDHCVILLYIDMKLFLLAFHLRSPQHVQLETGVPRGPCNFPMILLNYLHIAQREQKRTDRILLHFKETKTVD